MKIRIATRRSQLALTQTRAMAAALKALEPKLEIEECQVVTQGDKVLDRPLAEIGGKGLFVREVEAYLLRGEAELAVHSLKDVPGDEDLPEGLVIACIPLREEPLDWLCTRDGSGLDDLEAGARIGTTSNRRICQLRALRPDLDYRQLRGNVDTRLGKLNAGEFDGIILAAAGLRRLGLAKVPHVPLTAEQCLPAVGQGALALEIREDNKVLAELLRHLEDTRSRIMIEAERTLLIRLDGHCHATIGALASLDESGARLGLEAMVGDIHTGKMLRAGSEHFLKDRSREHALEAAALLGASVAQSLIDQGARTLIDPSRP